MNLAIHTETVTDVRKVEVGADFPLTETGDHARNGMFTPEYVTLTYRRANETGEWELDEAAATGPVLLEKELRDNGFVSTHIRRWHYPLLLENPERHGVPGWLADLGRSRMPQR